jgi:hypothetical protein
MLRFCITLKHKGSIRRLMFQNISTARAIQLARALGGTLIIVGGAQ